MVFGIIPECRSDSLRNMRSASPESPSLKADSPADLHGPRSGRAEALEGSLSGLTEGKRLRCPRSRLGIQSERVPGEICDVERVEHLAEHGQLVLFLDREILGQAKVLGERGIAELVVAW